MMFIYATYQFPVLTTHSPIAAPLLRKPKRQTFSNSFLGGSGFLTSAIAMKEYLDAGFALVTTNIVV